MEEEGSGLAQVHNGPNPFHRCHRQLGLYHRCYYRAANSCVHGLTENASEIGNASEATEASRVAYHESAPVGRDLLMKAGMEASACWRQKSNVHIVGGTAITFAVAAARDISMIGMVAGDESEKDGVVRASEGNEATSSEILLFLNADSSADMAPPGENEGARAHANVVAVTVAANVSVGANADEDAGGKGEDASETHVADAGVKHEYEHEDVVVAAAVAAGGVGENESASVSELAVRDETMKDDETEVEEDASEMKSVVEVVVHESEKLEVGRAGAVDGDWEVDHEDVYLGAIEILR